MKGKKRLSITIVILVPVFILGVLAIYRSEERRVGKEC